MKVYVNAGHDRQLDSGAVNPRLDLRECDAAYELACLVMSYLKDNGIAVCFAQNDNLYAVCDEANGPLYFPSFQCLQRPCQRDGNVDLRLYGKPHAGPLYPVQSESRLESA